MQKNELFDVSAEILAKLETAKFSDLVRYQEMQQLQILDQKYDELLDKLSKIDTTPKIDYA